MADTNPEPMIKLDAGGRAPILSYNVPEPTAYHGKNIIELKFQGKAEDYFKTSLTGVQTVLTGDQLKAKLIKDFKVGYFDPLYTNVELKSNYLKLKSTADDRSRATSNSNATLQAFVAFNPVVLNQLGFISSAIPAGAGASNTGNPQSQTPLYYFDSDLPLSQRLRYIDLDEITYWLSSQPNNGNLRYKLNIYKTLSGVLTYNFIKNPIIRPRILILESYRLSTYLGNYGAGRVLKTFSLLPGEKTRISVKTYKKTEFEMKQASSILDSYSEESAEDFENSVQREQSDKQSAATSLEYHADVSAEASWGAGSANASAGVKGSSNSAREEMAKNTTNAVSKHAAKASSKRDVSINTETNVKTTEGEDTETTREIQNINVGRTLNFIFRQMNQEFISILHLIDLRIAFYNGDQSQTREISLPQLNYLLDDFIQPAKIAEVKQAILNEVLSITNYKGEMPTRVSATNDGTKIKYINTNLPFVEEKYLIDLQGVKKSETKYYQFSKDALSLYTDETNNQIVVPGIIISAVKNVMRTDGVIVDSIIGQGDGLDAYSHGLQDEAIREKRLNNDLKEKEVARQTLSQSVITNGQVDKAKLFPDVYPAPVAKSSNG